MTRPDSLTCADAAAEMVAFHEGDLDAARHEALARHHRSCPPCAGAQRELETLSHWIGLEAEPQASPRFVGATVGAMRAAVAGSARTERATLRRLLPVVALAAALVIAFLLFVEQPRAPITLPTLARQAVLATGGRSLSNVAFVGLDFPRAPSDQVASLVVALGTR